LPSSDTKVCDNEKSFQVLQSGQVCMIGAFEPATGKQAMSVAPR
jgi:hypothetical protein